MITRNEMFRPSVGGYVIHRTSCITELVSIKFVCKGYVMPFVLSDSVVGHSVAKNSQELCLGYVVMTYILEKYTQL